MAKSNKKKIAFISSFLPRKCGIATFTNDLITNVKLAAKGNFEPLVVAMQGKEEIAFSEPVRFEIRQQVKNDYICAADYLNFSHVDVLSLQHEFGLFGGDAGSYLNLLLSRLNAPIITTLHTVLNDPTPEYYRSMIDVCNASEKIITMNTHGIEMLKEIYKIDNKKIELIPHGIPDLPFVDNNYYKHKFGMDGRRTILTFGLLSKNKGIEVMLQAMPEIIKAEPTALFVVLGMTHPSVKAHDGESYRFSLHQMVKDLSIENHVIFHNRFVQDEELHNFLCAADVYVTPYLNKEQLTSGTLAFAVGTGKAVVSTPYWAAEELLDEGRGRLVPFGDYKKIAAAVSDIFSDDALFYKLRRKAYDYGRSRTWPKIGQSYWQLYKTKRVPIRISSTPTTIPIIESMSRIEVPEPSLAHLKKLTDSTGLYQHAKFTIPNRKHGYCTDDNARAVTAMVKYHSQYADSEAADLLDKYLSFVMDAQAEDGSIRNFMHFDRSWMKKEPQHDALGRVLWAFGALMANLPSPLYLSIIKHCFDMSVKHVAIQSIRGKAYSILGLTDYLQQFPGASDIKRCLKIAADDIVAAYEKNSTPNWQWFEDILTYDNAILPHALFIAALALGENKYADVAQKTCDFLLEKTFTGYYFSFIGCKGWYKRDGKRAVFDQQAIEAAGSVMMLRSAYDVTLNQRYLNLQRQAFDWFLGQNDLCIPIYDFKTKGCCDGLTQSGVNINQGAESTVSFLLGLLCIVESYNVSVVNRKKTEVKKAAPIKEISTDEQTVADQVEEKAKD